MNTTTTTKTAVMLQPGDVVLEHYKRHNMNMATLDMANAETGTNHLVVQTIKPAGKYVAVKCKKRDANGDLRGGRIYYWTPNTELEVEA